MTGSDIKTIAFHGFAPLEHDWPEMPPPRQSGAEMFSPPDGSPTLEAVFDAYFDCRRHKRNSINQLRFEADLERNLIDLHRDLVDRTYSIGRSVAFVIARPKIREVWAAEFRDRIVHHLIYNEIAPQAYRRFIRDSYACIPGRGIHDGMERVSAMARSLTRNWTRPAHVMKIDVANFFNSIDRLTLLDIVMRDAYSPWLEGLIRQVILHDPRPDAIKRSSRLLFQQVPDHKSLMRAPPFIGLPIGNLTSQFFANVYMNELDQFAKHKLRIRHYGRYVDDVIMMHEDPAVLRLWCTKIDEFLQSRLGLRLHPNKVSLNKAAAGFDFIGFIIKPGRTYIRRSTVHNCKQVIRRWERKGSPLDPASLTRLSQSLTSYLAMLRRANTYGQRKAICARVEGLFLQANAECTKLKTG